MDLLKAYNKLASILSKNCLSNQPKGIGGMWTPDNEQDNGDLIHRTYSGGYEHTLFSRQFQFELVKGYTDAQGLEIHLNRGTPENVQKALNYYAEIIEST